MADAHGVRMHREDNGDRAGRLAGRLDLGRRRREDDIDLHTRQLGGCLVHLLNRARPAELDNKVLAFDITQIAQSRPKRLYPFHRTSGGAEAEESKARNSIPLLRTCLRRQRPDKQKGEEDRGSHAGYQTIRALSTRWGGPSAPPTLIVAERYEPAARTRFMVGGLVAFNDLVRLVCRT